VTLLHTPPESTPPRDTLAHVDTLAAGYQLGPLLSGRLHLTSVAAAGPSLTMRQAPDSTWDWAGLLPASEAPADTGAAMPIRIDRMRVTEGRFRAAFYAGGRDSIATVRGLTVRAADLHTAPAVRGRLDTLGLRAHLPGDDMPLRLGLGGRLAPTRVRLDTLRLTSSRSRVVGGGQARVPSDSGRTLDAVDLRLHATPFALHDLTSLVPGLALSPEETIQLALHVTGSGQRLRARADAAFSGGGALQVDAAATPTTSARDTAQLYYRLDATATDLTTSLVGPLRPDSNRITGSVDATLRGPSLSSLSGPMTAQLRETRWGSFRVPALTLNSTVENGTASLALEGTLNDAALAVEGQAQPFDTTVSASLTARVREANVGAFAPALGLESRLSGTLDVSGRALTSDAPQFDATLALAPSRFGDQSIRSGRLQLAVDTSEATVNGRLGIGGGSVRASGRAALDGSERFALTRARVNALDAAALLGDTTASQVNGSLALEGQGFAPETMRLDGRLALQDSHYGPYHLSALDGSGALEGGRVQADLQTTLNGGTWRLAATGRPFAPAPSVEVTEGRFRNVDIGPFLQDSTQSSALSGRLQASTTGLSPDTLAARLSVALDTSQVNRQRIDGGTLEARFAEGRATGSVALALPDGSLRLGAQAEPYAPTPSFRVTEGQFEGVDALALAGLSGSTVLSGTLQGRGRGTSAQDLVLEGRLGLSGSRINRAELSEGTLQVSAEQGRATLEGTWRGAGGRAQLRGTIDSLAHTPSYTVRTAAGGLDLAALAGTDSLAARLDTLLWTMEGRGDALSTLTADAQLRAGGRVGPLRVDEATLTGRLRTGRLTLDTLMVDSNVLQALGGGRVALADTSTTSDFSVSAQVNDLRPLRRLVGARTLQIRRGVVEARLYGAAGAQRFDGTLELTNLTYDDTRLAEADLTFNGQQGTDQPLRQARLRGALGFLSIGGLAVERTRMDATYDGSGATVRANTTLDQQHSGELEARVQPDSAATTIALRRLNLRMGPDQWSLQQPTTFTVGTAYTVDSLRLTSGAQHIAAHGVVDPSGTQDLTVDIENLNVGAVAPLAGLSGINGTLGMGLRLTGPAAAPTLDSDLDLQFESEDEPVGALQMSATYDSLRLALDAQLSHTNGSTLTAGGTLPADLRLAAPTPVDVSAQPVELDLSTAGFPLGWMDPFLDPATVQDVEGQLAADMAVRGTLENPALDGSASVLEGGAALPALGTRYSDGTARIRLAEDRLTVETLRVRSSNGGRMEATGVVNFPQLTVGTFDLSLNADDFIAIDTRAYRQSIIDGSMTLQGTTARPDLTGTVRVQSTDVYYSEVMAETASSLTAVSLTEQDQLVLEDRFGVRTSAADTSSYDAYEALSMDLAVQIERNSWLRSQSTPEMNIQFTGDLDLTKAHQEDPQVFGTIRVLEGRSTVRQFGQEFQITDGSLTFNGDPAAPYLNLSAAYEQRSRTTRQSEVRITLSLEGRPEDLSPSLSSQPPMDTRNILSYLATGRPAGALFGGRAGGGGNFATQMALGQATNVVENLAASGLGLDVVQLQIRPSGASYLTLGRYFTPRFYASIEQPVTTSGLSSSSEAAYVPDLTLEYRLTNVLVLRALNNQQSSQLNLLFERSY
jgi:translocation and assembly module TamB